MAVEHRKKFLARHWLRYPSVPAGYFWGRVQIQNELWMLARAGVAPRPIEISAATWAEISEQKAALHPRDVLQTGDLVAMSSHENKICLLAPCEGPPPQTQLHFATSIKWNIFTNCVREFFEQLGFIETPTPSLVPSPGTETHIEPFLTEFRHGDRKQTFFLPFSPEFHLKKLLALGWEKIFEIKTCYRNGELSPTHQPEFWMLEWYRAGESLESLVRDVQNLIAHASLALGVHQENNLQLQTQSVSDLFKAKLDFDLRPGTTRLELVDLARREDIHFTDDDSWDDLFFRLFLQRIEAGLGQNQPLIVCDYPPSQAALARINKRGWADRFEVYWRGMELANAFYELNDPEEQRRRGQAELDLRALYGRTRVPQDEEFLAALDYGLPPSSGIALGLERLFMALTGLASLEQVRAFPLTTGR